MGRLQHSSMRMLPTSNLSDAQLVDATKQLLRTERSAAAEIVLHLADLEIRKIHLAAGFPSLHAYCEEELQLTEYEASTGSKRPGPGAPIRGYSPCLRTARSR